METFTAKDKQIFEDMKQCVKDLGLKILNEDELGDTLHLASTFEYLGNNIEVSFIFRAPQNEVDLSIRYNDVQMEKITALYELVNHINTHMYLSHFCIEPHLRRILLRTGLHVTGYFLNKDEFRTLFNELFVVGHAFYPLIVKLVTTDQSPQSIMDEFYAARDKVASELLVSGDVRVTKMTSKKHPFTVEASMDIPTLSTHTHGMTELGMPEFLINHLAFGPKGNAYLINASYEYFMRPENVGKITTIKNGETVKLRDEDLKPPSDRPNPYVYCYRRVYPEFEMVKVAYCIEGPNDVAPNMWFVQIYVEGDDFALTDDYYKGGSKW